MKRILEFFHRTKVLFLVGILTVTGIGVATATTAPGDIVYTGRAIVLQARAKLLTSTTKVVLSDTGEMNGDGTLRETTFVNFDNDPPIEISSQTAEARTAGANGVSAANAIVERLRVKVGALNIAADVIEAHSEAECHLDSGTVSTRGHSTTANLTINGSPVVPASSQPNQVVNIAGVAKVTFNHQTNPDVNTIWVTAIKIEVPGAAGIGSAVIDISQAQSGIYTCNKL